MVGGGGTLTNIIVGYVSNFKIGLHITTSNQNELSACDLLALAETETA